MMNLTLDARPAKGAWAPGKYISKCLSCDEQFIGDKRAYSCAECAYFNGWRKIESAPREGFILLWCPEDRSRWFAAWQGGVWYGVDDMGLTREGHSAGDLNYVTGWFLTHWRPLPDKPSTDETVHTDGSLQGSD